MYSTASLIHLSSPRNLIPSYPPRGNCRGITSVGEISLVHSNVQGEDRTYATSLAGAAATASAVLRTGAATGAAAGAIASHEGWIVFD